jgi:soluble lytic murein transglycosylase-like protein
MLSGHSSRACLIAVLAAGAVIMLLAGAAAVIATVQGAEACVASAGGPPRAQARETIPSRLLPVFTAAERAYGVPWNVLAAINKVETDFGRNLGPSSAGAIGWMQFLPATWARYGTDADGDGRADPANPDDAIFSAAAYLRASGAFEDLRGALFAYNHSPAYVEQVLAWARRFAALPTRAANTLCVAGRSAASDMVRIAPGANLTGRPLALETLAFLARVAAIYGQPLVVTTGTNHSRYTVDGRVSDHADGHAADLGMTANGGSDDSPVGDRIMAACLIAAGEPAETAIAGARRGGLYTLEHNRLHVQCIWKTDQGGNHHNHVHVSARAV